MNEIIYNSLIMGGLITTGLISYYVAVSAVIPFIMLSAQLYLFNADNIKDYKTNPFKIYKIAEKSQFGKRVLEPINTLNPEKIEFQFLENSLDTDKRYLLWFSQNEDNLYDIILFKVPTNYTPEIILAYIYHTITRTEILKMKSTIIDAYYSKGGIKGVIKIINKFKK